VPNALLLSSRSPLAQIRTLLIHGMTGTACTIALSSAQTQRNLHALWHRSERTSAQQRFGWTANRRRASNYRPEGKKALFVVPIAVSATQQENFPNYRVLEMIWTINNCRVDVKYAADKGVYTFEALEYGVKVSDENVLIAQEEFRKQLKEKVR
jgi:hypothetical protein